jgi:hypothetical protein
MATPDRAGVNAALSSLPVRPELVEGSNRTVFKFNKSIIHIPFLLPFEKPFDKLRANGLGYIVKIAIEIIVSTTDKK